MVQKTKKVILLKTIKKNKKKDSKVNIILV